MKPRLPTAEERRLWRESNRFTQGIKEDGDAAHTAEGTDAVDTPPEVTLKPKARGTADASSLPAKSLSPLALLPAREAAKRFKAFPAEATLDLHGMGKTEAYTAVRRFLSRQHGRGARHVIIITGKGRPEEGVLKRELPHWLNEASLRAVVSAFGHARPERGGAGVMHVLLKKA